MSVSVIIGALTEERRFPALMPAPKPRHRAVPPGIPIMRTSAEAWTDSGMVDGEILDTRPRAGPTYEASTGPCVSPNVSRHA